jgi:hypothetical protein
MPGVNRYNGRAEERRTHSVAMTKAVSDATEGSSRDEIIRESLDVSNEGTTATHANLATEADLPLQEVSIKTTASAKPALPARSPDAIDTQQYDTEGSETKVKTETETNLLPNQDLNIPPTEIIQGTPHVPMANIEPTTDANEAADTEMGDAGVVDFNRLSIVNSPEVEPTSTNEDKLPAIGNVTDQEGGEPSDSRESSYESDFYEPPEATHSPFHVRTSSSSDQARTNAIGLTNQYTAGAEAQGDKQPLPPEQEAVIPIEKVCFSAVDVALG